MKPELYIIECKSNLHVGSGDSNYGVIDKLIQRDTTDEMPCIYSSSLKGAFREYFEEALGNKKMADEIFGGGENKGSEAMRKGSHIFQQAFMLSIPLRSNRKPYFNAIAPFMVEQLIELADLFGYNFPTGLGKELGHFSEKYMPKDNEPIIFEDKKDLEIEDFSVFEPSTDSLPELQKIIGNDIVILSNNDMKRLTNNYHLPIIARSKLENGKSQNLWYEQVVPRQSVFTAFVVNGGKVKSNDDFMTNVNCKTIQIGGDASVGYGYCHVYSLPKTTQP